MPLTPEEEQQIEKMVKKGTQEAIQETFKALGININDFDHAKEFRDNQVWVTRYRKAAEKVGSNVMVTLTTIITGGVIAAIWAYVTKR